MYKEKLLNRIKVLLTILEENPHEEYYQIILSELTGLMNEGDIPEDIQDRLDAISYGG